MEFESSKLRISEAIEELCIGNGDVRERLLNAYDFIDCIEVSSLPVRVRADWAEFICMLEHKGPHLDYAGGVRIGSVENTLRLIKNREGRLIAKKLYELHLELQKGSD